MTPAVERIRRAGAWFATHAYEHAPDAPAYGLEAAERLGVPPARVFKTLIAADPTGRLAVAVVPVTGELDLKAMATAMGWKKAVMAEPAAAERATGYVLGGISPLGQKRRLPLRLDESALTLDTLFVSGGRRGLEIELAPADLVALTDGRPAALTRHR